MGEENSSFFGAMFLTKIKQAGMARALLPVEERKTVYIYADEFHNIVTETFENLLSEARKFGLAMIMAHQYIGQLLPKVQSAVLGNVGTIVTFRTSGEDAVKLEPELAPVFKVQDMINLGRREFYIKLLIDGESYDPFSARTLDVLPPNHESFKEKIIQASRRKYSKPLETVLQEIRIEEGLVSKNDSGNNTESLETDNNSPSGNSAQINTFPSSPDEQKEDSNSNDELEPLI